MRDYDFASSVQSEETEMEQAKQVDINPVEIADGIFWLGYEHDRVELHCNPYLIREGDEAVLLDGGSRDDFSHVMLKILRTGLKPTQIKRLIYHHYDPDLCGNLPQLEAIIDSQDLRIISQRENNLFIQYYSKRTPKIDYHSIESKYVFESGRTLEFYGTPFCHSPGSFVTFDTKTKTLFSSDLFGSYDENWQLYLELVDELPVDATNPSPEAKRNPLYGIEQFHKRIMTSKAALQHALDVIESIDYERIAPQHGSIIRSRTDAKIVIDHLRRMRYVGIDALVAEKKI